MKMLRNMIFIFMLVLLVSCIKRENNELDNSKILNNINLDSKKDDDIYDRGFLIKELKNNDLIPYDLAYLTKKPESIFVYVIKSEWALREAISDYEKYGESSGEIPKLENLGKREFIFERHYDYYGNYIYEKRKTVAGYIYESIKYDKYNRPIEKIEIYEDSYVKKLTSMIVIEYAPVKQSDNILEAKIYKADKNGDKREINIVRSGKKENIYFFNDNEFYFENNQITKINTPDKKWIFKYANNTFLSEIGISHAGVGYESIKMEYEKGELVRCINVFGKSKSRYKFIRYDKFGNWIEMQIFHGDNTDFTDTIIREIKYYE
ncbi:hypothetical protein H0R90_12705 [Treponema putidum]|uniref:hypothetical protein n=1 Tax=Treponema putidum TaxID=221027 RepID=UPI0004F6984D|nr:hypothetical protein [Treponema putidum]AIN94809.1 hypothetical protein JO40_12690 [Treponema putidum]TWI71698.1 hypothetical protein JM98_02577 [Treponema putidum]